MNGEIYQIARGGAALARLSIEELNTAILDGSIHPSDYVFIPDSRDWWPVAEIPQLAALLYRPEEKPVWRPHIEKTSLPEPRKPMGPLAEVSRSRISFGGTLTDRRKWIRLQDVMGMKIGFVHDLLQEPEKKQEVQTLDISEAGIAFQWNTDLRAGTLLQVDIDFFPDTIRAGCRVAGSSETNIGDFHIGLQFLKISEEDKLRIRKYIYQHADRREVGLSVSGAAPTGFRKS